MKHVKQEHGIKVLIRIPQEMKSWLEEEAKRNWTSQNAEVIRAIRSRIDSEQPERATG